MKTMRSDQNYKDEIRSKALLMHMYYCIHRSHLIGFIAADVHEKVVLADPTPTKRDPQGLPFPPPEGWSPLKQLDAAGSAVPD
jgi:hypothetical protein